MNSSKIVSLISNNNTNAEVFEEIGGILYFLKYLSEYLPYSLLSSIGVVVGLLGNILIIGAIISTKELHTTTYMLIFNLSLADLVISSFVDLFTVIGKRSICIILNFQYQYTES